MIKLNWLMAICFVITLNSCKKNNDEPESAPTDLEKKILTDFVNVVALPNYSEIKTMAAALNTAIINLDNQPTDSNLLLAQNAWRNMRKPWEQCEGWLFGPVEDLNFDPEIDDWPVNRVDLDSLLASNAPLDLNAIQGFQTSLKGFHPLEYLIFGNGGSKTAAQLTMREREYMKGLSLHLESVSKQIYQSWDPLHTGNFSNEIITAGTGSNRFPKRKDAFIALVTAMEGICDEVAGGKMEEPLLAQDSTLEESQFAHNSLADFKDNITGVGNVYFCRYHDDGTGLNEWVASKNISLDNKIQQQINTAIASFNSITLPYSQAIFTQQIQIVNAQNAIHALKSTLENELLPFIENNIKD